MHGIQRALYSKRLPAEFPVPIRNALPRSSKAGRSRLARSSFLAMAASGFAGLLPLALRAQTDPDLIHVATVPIDAGAEAYFAADAGFFRNAGLNVDVGPL